MTNKNSTKLLFKTYRQPITVINLTGVNFNQGKDCLRATEIRKGHTIIDLMLCNKVTCLLMKNHGTSLFFHIFILFLMLCLNLALTNLYFAAELMLNH